MSVVIIATCRFDVMDFWSLALTHQTNVTVRILYGKVNVSGLGMTYNIIVSHVCEDLFF